jgi:hypothetical protein
MLGATCDAAIFAATMKSLMSAEHWTGQASNQRSTPSYVERWLQGKSRKVKAGSQDQPIAAQAAQVWQQTVGRYLTTE